ncbi:F-box domain protein [Oesophagostomum dentatum]|uniref:F-box domain protein n=1 Tax=Oesophagostomum dentatum TaxID=61180 RepID=A0A0B1T5J9_OESDE|nr:F-box domain protein [Oesophagostomum dentatum]
MEEDVNFPLNFDIDVFEEKFTRWNELPVEVKIQILQYLPFHTLRNFMFLSKDCLAVASNVKISVYGVYFQDKRCIYNTNISNEEASLIILVAYEHRWKNPGNSCKREYRIIFAGDENGGCFVRRLIKRRRFKYSKALIRYENETCGSAAFRVFLHLMRNLKSANVTIQKDSIYPEIERVLKEEPSSPPFSCERFSVATEDRKLIPLLPKFLAPGCELSFSTSMAIYHDEIFADTEFCSSELMRAAPRFETEALVGVTDEQLPYLQASMLSMNAPYITSKGINGMILASLFNWLDGKRKIVRIVLRQTQELKNEVVLDGVDHSLLTSQSEMSKDPYLSCKLEGFVPSGRFTGITNKTGAFMVVNVCSNYCTLFDPYWE